MYIALICNVWRDWFGYWLMNEWLLVLDIMFCDKYDGFVGWILMLCNFGEVPA